MSNLLTQLLFVLRKYFFRLMIFSAIVMAAFCIFSYVQSFQTASVILAFTYPNASDGLYPNGTFFNAYSIFTDDIIDKAISDAGLDGRVNRSKFADEITIRPRSNASLITTQFIISYTAGKDDQLGAVSTAGLLNSLIYSYIDHFHNTYSNDQIVLDLDTIDAETSEYVDLVHYYNVALNQLQKYLSAQQVNDKDFLSDDGTSFQELINIIERYRVSSLNEINSIITERGVAYDRAAYIKRLNYRIWKLTNNYDYNRNMQQLYKSILNDYEARLTSVVFIPSLDSSREFYMSKTKIGIDILASKATDFEEKAETVQYQIRQTEQYISMITNKKNSSVVTENTARVDALIAELRNQLDATMKRIQLFEKEYSRYRNHNYVTMMPVERSFMERTQAKKAVILTAIIDLALVVHLMARQQKKKGKESN